jgi:hypothetical protein
MRRRKNKPSLRQLPIGEYVFSLVIGRSSNKKKRRENLSSVCLSHNTVGCLFALLAYVRNRMMIIITTKRKRETERVEMVYRAHKVCIFTRHLFT